MPPPAASRFGWYVLHWFGVLLLIPAPVTGLIWLWGYSFGPDDGCANFEPYCPAGEPWWILWVSIAVGWVGWKMITTAAEHHDGRPWPFRD
jgi:hypothetical protein